MTPAQEFFCHFRWEQPWMNSRIKLLAEQSADAERSIEADLHNLMSGEAIYGMECCASIVEYVAEVLFSVSYDKSYLWWYGRFD